MTDDDRAVVVEAAGSASVAGVGLMLDLGLSPRARNGVGEQPLHTAAYVGNAEMVRLLIDAGADVGGRDTRLDATPLAFATVGSGELAGQTGNWIQVVRALVEAGAPRGCVWISGKPPSEEVIDLLRGYGITPDDEPEPQLDDQTEVPGADGIQATVESVEVDGDAIVLGLSVPRQAEEARPAPPELLYQVFTVGNAQVTEMHVYPDRASALARPTR